MMVIWRYPLVICDSFAIENGPVEIVDLPIKNGGSFHSYVRLPEGIYIYLYWKFSSTHSLTGAKRREWMGCWGLLE